MFPRPVSPRSPAPGCRTRPVLCALSWGVLTGDYPGGQGLGWRPAPRGGPALVDAAAGSTHGDRAELGLGKLSGCRRSFSQVAQSQAGSAGHCPPPALRRAFRATTAELRSCDGTRGALGARGGGRLAFCRDVYSPRSFSFRGHRPWSPVSGPALALTSSCEFIVTATPVKLGCTFLSADDTVLIVIVFMAHLY